MTSSVCKNFIRTDSQNGHFSFVPDSTAYLNWTADSFVWDSFTNVNWTADLFRITGLHSVPLLTCTLHVELNREKSQSVQEAIPFSWFTRKKCSFERAGTTAALRGEEGGEEKEEPH